MVWGGEPDTAVQAGWATAFLFTQAGASASGGGGWMALAMNLAPCGDREGEGTQPGLGRLLRASTASTQPFWGGTPSWGWSQGRKESAMAHLQICLVGFH